MDFPYSRELIQILDLANVHDNIFNIVDLCSRPCDFSSGGMTRHWAW